MHQTSLTVDTRTRGRAALEEAEGAGRLSGPGNLEQGRPRATRLSCQQGPAFLKGTRAKVPVTQVRDALGGSFPDDLMNQKNGKNLCELHMYPSPTIRYKIPSELAAQQNLQKSVPCDFYNY